MLRTVPIIRNRNPIIVSKSMNNSRKGRRLLQEITAPQLRPLQVIRFFTVENGFTSTIKELSGVLGISHASVHDQINQLVRKGYLKRGPRKARGIVIVRVPDDKQPKKNYP